MKMRKCISVIIILVITISLLVSASVLWYGKVQFNFNVKEPSLMINASGKQHSFDNPIEFNCGTIYNGSSVSERVYIKNLYSVCKYIAYSVSSDLDDYDVDIRYDNGSTVKFPLLILSNQLIHFDITINVYSIGTNVIVKFYETYSSYSVPQPVFNVTASADEPITINKETIMIPLSISDNLLDRSLFSVDFTTNIIPSLSCSSLSTIFFETDYLMTYNGEYILDNNESGYYANWSWNNHQYDYSGHMYMFYTETKQCQIQYKLNSAPTDSFSSELNNVGDTGSWDITFHNSDWSWSEIYTVNWIVTSIN